MKFETNSILGSKNKFAGWISNLATRACSTSEELYETNKDSTELIENAYYAPTISAALSEFLSKLPLSGCIMNKNFGSTIISPTSSATEREFGLIKNDLFHRQTNTRIDNWLSLHIKYLKGRISGMKAHEVRQFMALKASDTEDSNSDDEMKDKTQNNQKKIIEEKQKTNENDSSSSNNSSSSSDSRDSYDSKDAKTNKYENFRNQNEDGEASKKKVK